MKGLNVKRIAALATGAAILGASLAVADVTFGNTPIINQNGQPLVKVVVGSKAAASDGVVAANIAAVIGNNAYSKQTLSATLSGTATCTTTASGSGAGTCPVSDKKVTLEVTLPGVVSGSASFKTYINDYVDKYTQDRKTSPYGVGNNYSTTTEIKPCFTTNPVDGNLNASATSGVCEIRDPYEGDKHGRKLTGGDFPALATVTVRDTYGTRTYTEEQSLWVYGSTVYDETGKTIVADKPNIAYKIDFTHDVYGLPLYSCSNYCVPGSTGCTTCSESDATDRHRVSIKFLGEDWIISGMNPPSGMSNFDPSKYLAKTAAGSSISLAKESAYGIIHIGENLTAGAYTIKLADIGLATGSDNVHPAAIEIYDANGVRVKEDQIRDFQSTYSWSAPDGSKLKIRVYQTQPGYTLASKWAEMAVYSNEITLTHGNKMDNVDNPLWYPYLYWSNNPNNNNVTTLKTVVLRRDPNAAETFMLKLQKGESINVITTPAKFQMTFAGIDLGSADYDALSVSVTGSTTLAYGSGGCGNTNTVTGRFLQVNTGITNAFTVSGSPVSTFYIDLSNIDGDGTYAYYQPSGFSCFFRTALGNGTEVATYNLGDGVTQTLSVTDLNYTNGEGAIILDLEERASTTTDASDRLRLELENVSDSTWVFAGSSTQTKIKYLGASRGNNEDAGPAGYTGWKSVDPGFTTERGSVFVSLNSKQASLKIAKKVAEATYYVSTVGSAPSGSTEITLAEGEEQTLAGGVKIKAKSITERVGSCTVTGGAGTCSVNMAPVKAILNSGEESKDVMVPYKVGELVALDKDNPSAAVLISVGGPMVNTVTAEALLAEHENPSPLTKPGEKLVKEIGNKIIVAGYTAEDTVAAGKEFLMRLQST